MVHFFDFITTVVLVILYIRLDKKYRSLLKDNIALQESFIERFSKKISNKDMVFPLKFENFQSKGDNMPTLSFRINEQIFKGIEVIKHKIANREMPVHCIYYNDFSVCMVAVQNENDDLYSIRIICSTNFHILKLDNILFTNN
jgi:hypothetical protein